MRAGAATQFAAVVPAVSTFAKNSNRPPHAALTLGIGCGFIGTGLYVSRRRPQNSIGLLMTAVGFSGFLKSLAFSNNSLVFMISSLGEVLIDALLVLAVGSLTFVLLMTSLVAEQANLSSKIDDALTLALFGSIACLPFAFLLGLLRSRFNPAEAINSIVGQVAGGSRGGLGGAGSRTRSRSSLRASARCSG